MNISCRAVAMIACRPVRMRSPSCSVAAVDTTSSRAAASISTGTFIDDSSIKAQAFAGYINAKSGRKLAYQLVVNNVPFKTIDDVIQIFQDEGTISAILWRDN